MQPPSAQHPHLHPSPGLLWIPPPCHVQAQRPLSHRPRESDGPGGPGTGPALQPTRFGAEEQTLYGSVILLGAPAHLPPLGTSTQPENAAGALQINADVGIKEHK